MKVLSLIDSLVAAGAERVAVNIANGLSDMGIESHLCATRSGGPLEEFINQGTRLKILYKKSMVDPMAFKRLHSYAKTEGINILHAHSSSVFWAVGLKLALPGAKIVWHDHYGFSEQLHHRPKFLLRLAAPFIDHAFVVNEKLRQFAASELQIDRQKISFLPNFADLNHPGADGQTCNLPGLNCYPRIVCLANLRPQKDHHTLLDAFARIRQSYPEATLYLAGGHFNDDYYLSITKRVANDKTLNGRVHVLGSRNDVSAILQNCDMGILSSASEGLPVSLLEYGMAGLPVVSTNVGDCSLVLDHGRCGKLVMPGNSWQLAEAVIQFLDNPGDMQLAGRLLNEHVTGEFSKQASMDKITQVYNWLLKNS